MFLFFSFLTLPFFSFSSSFSFLPILGIYSLVSGRQPSPLSRSYILSPSPPPLSLDRVFLHCRGWPRAGDCPASSSSAASMHLHTQLFRVCYGCKYGFLCVSEKTMGPLSSGSLVSWIAVLYFPTVNASHIPEMNRRLSSSPWDAVSS